MPTPKKPKRSAPINHLTHLLDTFGFTIVKNPNELGGLTYLVDEDADGNHCVVLGGGDKCPAQLYPALCHAGACCMFCFDADGEFVSHCCCDSCPDVKGLSQKTAPKKPA